MLEERNLRNRTGNERQPESTAPIQMKPDGVPAGRENQHRSRRRSGDSTEHSQESVTVDDVSSGLRSRAYSTKQDGLTDGCRARKSKDIRRSITLKSLAAEFDFLKREVQDLKMMLAHSQSLPNERYQKKRVSFQDNVS
ncbi:hypothetical protein N7534_003577 [Penicillium rubens]|nr:hypothetical protein N7534_003577 [Penicillium rubens]